jgi:hypothetical protein
VLVDLLKAVELVSSFILISFDFVTLQNPWSH